MSRRNVLTQLAALPLMVAAGSSSIAAEKKVPLKIMMKSAWGSDDPTKAAFPFLHGHALAEAGHNVQMFLLGEAVSLMRFPWAGPRSRKQCKKLWPVRFRFLLVARAPAPAE